MSRICLGVLAAAAAACGDAPSRRFQGDDFAYIMPAGATQYGDDPRTPRSPRDHRASRDRAGVSEDVTVWASPAAGATIDAAGCTAQRDAWDAELAEHDPPARGTGIDDKILGAVSDIVLGPQHAHTPPGPARVVTLPAGPACLIEVDERLWRDVRYVLVRGGTRWTFQCDTFDDDDVGDCYDAAASLTFGPPVSP